MIDFLMILSSLILQKEEQRQAIVAQVKKRYQVISPHLSEQAKRLWAASEALAIGRGGTTLVGEATGMS